MGAILGVTLLVLLATSAGYFCRVPGYDDIEKVDRPIKGVAGPSITRNLTWVPLMGTGYDDTINSMDVYCC